jgi:hypothetical protein
MRALIITLLILMGAAKALNITEYRGVVFYPNGSQEVYTDKLLVNSTEEYGANITYGKSFFTPSVGSYVFSLPRKPFNLSVVVEAQESWVVYKIKNNYDFVLNISANITATGGAAICGNHCLNAEAEDGYITANFSIPSNETGELFIIPTSSLLEVGESYLKFSYSSLAEVNTTLPLLVDIEKNSYDNKNWYATFNVKNLEDRDAIVSLRGWYEVNGSTFELFNYSLTLPGNASWSTSRSIVTSGVPTFYIIASAVNTSLKEVRVIPAYPANLSNLNAGYVYGEALVLSNVTLTAPALREQIEISSFSVVPNVVTRNQIVDFAIEVENTGNLATTIEPEIEIYSGNSLLDKIVLMPMTLAAGSNITLVKSYLVALPPGSYSAVAKVYYDNRSSYVSAIATLRVETEGEKEEGGREAFIRETPHLRFAFLPVLIEGKPGDTSTVAFEVENPSSEDVDDLRLSIEGLPQEWATLEPREISLRGGESIDVTLSIRVPLSALPGDHKAVLVLKNVNEEASAFFMFRIKPYPPRFEKPAVLREVYLNEREDTARVRVKVENSGVRVERLEIVEEISKEIASNVAEIRFKSPVTVIEADPIIAWRLSEIDPYEAYTLEYEVTRIAERYSPYIYWPLRQINLFYSTIRGIDLLQFSGALAAYARPGEEAEVKLRVINPSLEALNLTFKIVAPPGWEVSPGEITRLLLPGYMQELVFIVTPPRDALPGSYTLTATVASEDGEVSQPLTLILLEEERRINLRRFLAPALGIAALILIAYAALTKYRKRKVYRRDVVEAVERIKESMKRE